MASQAGQDEKNEAQGSARGAGRPRTPKPARVQIRLAGYPDAEAIMGLDDGARMDRGRTNFIYKMISDRHCHVATLDGQVAAYGVLEYSFFGHGFLSIIFVAPEHRRRTIGSQLVRAMEKICNTDRLFTTAARSDIAMQALMAGLQYKRSGRIDNLEDDEPKLVFFVQPRKG
jgi:GNAT superfamily N-acetyltransferase